MSIDINELNSEQREEYVRQLIAINAEQADIRISLEYDIDRLKRQLELNNPVIHVHTPQQNFCCCTTDGGPSCICRSCQDLKETE